MRRSARRPKGYALAFAGATLAWILCVSGGAWAQGSTSGGAGSSSTGSSSGGQGAGGSGGQGQSGSGASTGAGKSGGSMSGSSASGGTGSGTSGGSSSSGAGGSSGSTSGSGGSGGTGSGTAGSGSGAGGSSSSGAGGSSGSTSGSGGSSNAGSGTSSGTGSGSQTSGRKGTGSRAPWSRRRPVMTAGTRLPRLAQLRSINGKLWGYRRISNWVPGMGYHWGHLGPSLVLMTNNNGQVVGMEQAFPNVLPYHTWMDPQTSEFNAGRAQWSQHLMFVAPSSITPSMPMNVASATASWDQFKALNGGHVVPYMQLKPFKPGYGSLWGPDGPALRILLDSKERVVGGVMGVPARYGWNSWYDQPQGQPLHDAILGNVYTQTVFLVPRWMIR